MSDLYGVLTRTDDEVAVTFEREYATSCRDLWSALTEPDRLARWMDPVDGDFRTGGEVVVHFDDGDARFAIDTCEAPTLLAVRWRGERDTVLRASVFDLGGDRARLTLVHERLSEPQAPEYAAGWHWHLAVLEGLLTGREATPPAWDELAGHYAAAMSDVRTARV